MFNMFPLNISQLLYQIYPKADLFNSLQYEQLQHQFCYILPLTIDIRKICALLCRFDTASRYSRAGMSQIDTIKEYFQYNKQYSRY